MAWLPAVENLFPLKRRATRQSYSCPPPPPGCQRKFPTIAVDVWDNKKLMTSLHLGRVHRSNQQLTLLQVI